MAYSKVDAVFINAFQERFIKHLKKEPTPGAENEARVMVRQAIDLKIIGKLSRIFDSLALPITSQEQFFKDLEEAGSMEAYMRPTLNAAASLLLNGDKSRLRDDVIMAIGVENYADLVGGVIEGKKEADGTDNRKVVAPQGQEETFAEKEAQVAQTVLSAVVVNYAQSAEAYNLTAEEKVSKQMLNNLYVKIKEIEELIVKYHIVPQPSPALSETMFNSLNELNNAAQQAISACNSVQGNIDSEYHELLNVLRQAKEVQNSGNLTMEPRLHHFLNNVTTPLQQLATNFTMDKLKEPAPKISLDEITKQTDVFLQIALHSQQEIKKLETEHRRKNSLSVNDPLPPEIQKPKAAIQQLVDKLQEAKDTPSIMEGAPDEAIRDKMLNGYNVAVKHFVDNVSNDIIQVKPPEKLMHIVLRCLRFIFVGGLTTKEEKEDQERFKQESTLKEDLLALKTRLPDIPSETKVDISEDKVGPEEGNKDDDTYAIVESYIR